MSDLVIVESPAKAKTIKKYLGKDYEVRTVATDVDNKEVFGKRYKSCCFNGTRERFAQGKAQR